MAVKRRPFAIYEFSPSMTKQSFAQELDINEIIRRAVSGQDVSGAFRDRVAQYGDFSKVPSYQEALNLVNEANAMFMSLDVHVRERFGNDPDKLIRFIQDDKNYDEAVKLGLVAVKPVVPVPAVVPVGGSSLEERIADLEADVIADRGDSVRPKASSDSTSNKAKR